MLCAQPCGKCALLNPKLGNTFSKLHFKFLLAFVSFVCGPVGISWQALSVVFCRISPSSITNNTSPLAWWRHTPVFHSWFMKTFKYSTYLHFLLSSNVCVICRGYFGVALRPWHCGYSIRGIPINSSVIDFLSSLCPEKNIKWYYLGLTCWILSSKYRNKKPGESNITITQSVQVFVFPPDIFLPGSLRRPLVEDPLLSGLSLIAALALHSSQCCVVAFPRQISGSDHLQGFGCSPLSKFFSEGLATASHHREQS